MRVLHVQKVDGVGGSERHLLSLLPGLIDAGVEVRMCVLGTESGAAAFTTRLSELGVPHTRIASGPDLNPALVWSLTRQIRAFGPDLVHTHLIHADLHGQVAARVLATPGISSIHGAHSFYGQQPYRSAAILAGRLARRTIAISEHVHRFVEKLRLSRGPGTIRTVHYGIDASPWDIGEEAREEARASLGLQNGTVAIGIAARMIPHKGHDILLDAYARASRRLPGIRLLLAGDGPLRADLEDHAARLGAEADFLGFVADIRGFMSACDLVVFPSQLEFPSRPEFGEGFGLAALEAMAASRPVIASATCSLPEVIGPDGGMLVEPADVEALSDALVRLSSDQALRRSLGTRARERALASFSLERMVGRTVTVYDEALAETR